MPKSLTVRVPATSANLGPGFDCLALSLDLWNETSFRLEGENISVEIEGEGQQQLAGDESNLILRAFFHFYDLHKQPRPSGLALRCTNHIPLGSGLGSSAAATLTGLLAADVLLGAHSTSERLLQIAGGFERHSDNAAAALLGGLIVVVADEEARLTRRFDCPPLQVAVAIPQIDFPTRTARSAIPQMITLEDAVYNLGRTALVVEALRSGDLELLGQAMTDRLHQPYRLEHIPGAADAIRSARAAGAAAAALSGAGPGVIALAAGEAQEIAAAMAAAFEQAGLAARRLALCVTNDGAAVESVYL